MVTVFCYTCFTVAGEYFEAPPEEGVIETPEVPASIPETAADAELKPDVAPTAARCF